MSVLYTSFYTARTPYEQEIKGLRQDLERFRLPYDIRARHSKSDWRLNCFMKPYHILECLRQHPTYDLVVWLDGDARLQQNPDPYFAGLLPAAPSMCLGARLVHRSKTNVEFYAGMLAVANIPLVHSFLRDVIKTIEHDIDTDEHHYRHDQDAFAKIETYYTANLGGWEFVEIPSTYSALYWRKEDDPENAVILQTQASRRLKKDIR